MNTKPGYYWVRVVTADGSSITIGRLEEDGWWSLIGSDNIFREEITILSPEIVEALS